MFCLFNLSMKFGMFNRLDRNHGNPLILRIRVQTVVCLFNLSMKFGMFDLTRKEIFMESYNKVYDRLIEELPAEIRLPMRKILDQIREEILGPDFKRSDDNEPETRKVAGPGIADK